MSIEHARQFVQHLHTDEALRNRVHISKDDILKAAQEKGLTVTHEEMRIALNEHWTANPGSGVLSETPGF